jgi:AAA family ATP:ADP antiporter
MIISAMQTLLRPLFGTFEKEEFKKFLRMGLTFACVIGAYWTIRTLKNSMFGVLAGPHLLPWGKVVSIMVLIPMVMLYTKILDKVTRERAFYGISMFYGVMTVVFALLLANGSIGEASEAVIAARTGWTWYGTKILAFAWYIFVESYGSLVIALFWAIASDTTLPDSAKRGFSLVVALGQVGSIVGPEYICQLPRLLGFETGAIAVAIASLMMFASILALKYVLAATPKELLVSFKGKNEAAVEKEQEPGLLEGFWLLIEHKYLLAIFSVGFVYEFIITVFDFHFQTLAKATYSGHAYHEFLGHYGSYVNTVALVCLLLGVSNITRYLGIKVALALMPIIVGGAIFGFTSFDSLTFLFWLMVGSKAINYALNGPALKQLYIPTTHDTRFKAQAWIETFGSRSSKGAGSGFNMLYGPLQLSLGAAAGRARHVLLSSYVGYALVCVWFFIALFLGNTYQKAVDEKRVVC